MDYTSKTAIAAFAIIFTVCFIGMAANSNTSPGPIFSGKVLALGSSASKSIFTGERVSLGLNPRPEPPIVRIGKNNAKGLFSGQIALPPCCISSVKQAPSTGNGR